MAASLLPAKHSFRHAPVRIGDGIGNRLPFTRFSACGRLRSARRSHSQADSRGGRPNRSRKPSLPTCGSGTCEAFVSSGTSGKAGRAPAARGDPVHQLLGGQPPRDGVREVVARPSRSTRW